MHAIRSFQSFRASRVLAFLVISLATLCSAARADDPAPFVGPSSPLKNPTGCTSHGCDAETAAQTAYSNRLVAVGGVQ